LRALEGEVSWEGFLLGDACSSAADRNPGRAVVAVREDGWARAMVGRPSKLETGGGVVDCRTNEDEVRLSG